MSKFERDRLSLLVDLSRLVDVEATAEWRRQQACRSPENSRFREAAEMLDRLAPEIAALHGCPLHFRLEAYRDVEAFDLEINGTLKAVGFYYFPNSARQLLEDILSDLERRYGPRPHLRMI